MWCLSPTEHLLSPAEQKIYFPSHWCFLLWAFYIPLKTNETATTLWIMKQNYFICITLFVATIFSACSTKQKESSDMASDTTKTPKASVSRADYGKLSDATPVSLYTLTNELGTVMTIT